jgi:hypothetical protein
LQNSAEVQVVTQLEEKLKTAQAQTKGAQAQTKEKQTLLDQTIALLGKSEIKTLADLQNLLKGQTLKELTTQLAQQSQQITSLKTDQAQKEQTIIGLNNSYEKLESSTSQQIKDQVETIKLTQQKIQELELQHLNLAKQKIANKKEAKALIEELEKQWKDKQKE